MAKKNYLKNLIANSKLASKVGLGMLLVAPLFMASSCEKPCDETDPKSDCYVQPTVPPVEQHTTTYTFHVDDVYVITPEDKRIEQSADSVEVGRIIVKALDEGWDRVSSLAFGTVANCLEAKREYSPKVETTGTMTHQAGGIDPNDSLRLVEMGIKLPVKEY
jgi:hypothetical protein